MSHLRGSMDTTGRIGPEESGPGLQARGFGTTQNAPVPALAGAAAAARVTAAALRRHQRMMGLLVLGLDSSQLSHVDGLGTSQATWQALERVHLHTTAGTKIHVTRSLFEMCLCPGRPVRDHIMHMLAFPEELKVYILLSSLDKSYENLCLTLEAMPTEQLTLEFITGRLCDEEQRWQTDGGQVGSGYPESRSRGAGRSEVTVKAFSSRHCFHCGLDSHLVRQCPVEPQEAS